MRNKIKTILVIALYIVSLVLFIIGILEHDVYYCILALFDFCIADKVEGLLTEWW